MIYTITLSPAIDYKFQVQQWDFNRTMRPENIQIVAGGKGINVSIVLDNLEAKNTAILTAGGQTKEMFLNLLSNQIKSKKVFNTKNNVRINIKGHSKKGDLELNDRTKPFSNNVIEDIQNYLVTEVKESDYVVFSGSPPTGLNEDIFKTLLKKVKVKVNIVVDSRKEYIVPLINLKPFLLKPNKQELEDFVGKRIDTMEEVYASAKELNKQGVENVLVSLDKEGSILFNKEGAHRIHGEKNLNIIDPTGAGDSMVAGFIFAHSKKWSYEKCHKFAVAAAISTITSSSLANAKDIDNWMKKIR